MNPYIERLNFIRTNFMRHLEQQEKDLFGAGITYEALSNEIKEMSPVDSHSDEKYIIEALEDYRLQVKDILDNLE